MRLLFCFIVIALAKPELLAQTKNDNIEQKIELQLDSTPIFSSTKNASVQWECINKKLTSACLIYHNDQWFSFIPALSGKYYINVANQQCKNLKGVQVLVIEGNPCKTDTYKLKHCTSFTDQNDTFIELDSLHAKVEYLINIDGFLGDQCDFFIQFATTPNGFGNNWINMDTLSLEAKNGFESVILQWHTNQEVLESLSSFEISRMRRNEKKANILDQLVVQTNARGRHIEEYFYVDSLDREGTYIYSIIGVDKITEDRRLLDETRITIISSKPVLDIMKYVAQMNLGFPYKGSIELLVFDGLSKELLDKRIVDDGRNRVVPIDLTNLIIAGHRHFSIQAKNLISKNVKTRRFSIGQNGELIQIK